MKGFASDNNSGIHPLILKAIGDANIDHTIGYGEDPYTKKAIQLFKDKFGQKTEVFFVFNGTGANVIGLSSAINSFNSIICAETAHINVDECGAPEKITGAKIVPTKHINGKISPETITPHFSSFGFQHHSQPKIISITQVTELGTLYTPDEIKALADLAHQNGMYLHMDGARLANAAVALNMDFREFTVDCGVDILSFGGTKNGLMIGEAILFFNPELAKNTIYIRKNNAQLFSKMRFIGAQFIAYFENDLWKKNATHANNMAKLLAGEIAKIPEIKITLPVESNGIFAIIPEKLIEPLRNHFFFYMWDETINEARWLTSFDTTEDEIYSFVILIKQLLN